MNFLQVNVLTFMMINNIWKIKIHSNISQALPTHYIYINCFTVFKMYLYSFTSFDLNCIILSNKKTDSH